MKIRYKFISRISMLIALVAVTQSGADDTDIYLNQNAASTDKPMIMFSLDYRSSLGNTVCSDNEDTTADGICGQLVEEGYLDTDAIRENGNYSSLELFRAVLKKIMDHELEAGVTIADAALFGLMMNHHNINNCDPGDTDCSNGGFMLSRFRDLSNQTDYDFFFNALETVPIPNLTWNQVTSGSNQCNAYGSNTGEHQYQGAELFFEFFRYLTGQQVYFGHTGFEDFGTDDDENMDNPAGLLAAPRNGNDLTCRTSPVWDASAEDDNGEYVSPLVALDPNGCGADIYTFNFLFQVSNQEEDANCGILQNRANGGMDGIAGNPNNCNISSNGPAGTFGEVLEFMRDVDLGTDPSGTYGSYGDVPDLPGLQNVTSYFFVPTTSVNNTTNSYANAGGTTGAIGLDLTDIDLTLDRIIDVLEQVLSVSTTFVSPTLPSNVFNRTDLLEQVYIAIFKANENLQPRWTGNLKRLNINSSDPSNPFLAGDDGSGGISDLSAIAADGRINPSTLTVWSHSEDVPAPPDPITADYREGRDGRSTVHGGAGGNMPGYRLNYEPGNTNNAGSTEEYSSRIIYTEPDNRSSSTLRAFDADNPTAVALLEIGGGGTPISSIVDDYKQIKIDLWRTLLPYPDCSGYDMTSDPEPANCHNYNVANTADRITAIARLLDVLAYGRGYVSFGGPKRDWFMEDPLHARPVAINFGGANAASQVIRLVISTNGGFLHFFRESDGVEEWAFSPRSVTQVQHRLQANTIGSAPVHPYTLDGTPVVLKIDSNNDGTIQPASDKVFIYTGMRRGGKHYYALDVTDYNAPEMLWSISKDDPDFSELAQTWSDPAPILIRYEVNGTAADRLALIFGGGYNGDDDGDDIDLGKDERDDADTTFTGTNDDEGNAIYIVDAETGELIWKATGIGSGATGPVLGDERLYYHSDMLDSIPAKVTAVNATNSSDNYHDRAYVGDTGGVIWRVDFSSLDRSQWKVTRLANLGRHDTAGDQTHDRRFFHAADFVLSQDEDGAFDGVVIASGNRPNPLSDSTDNYLYVIKDRNTNAAPSSDSPTGQSELQDLSDNCLQDDDASDCSGFDILTQSLPALERGWKLKLEVCTDETISGSCGEKGLSQPLVLFGKIFFNSYVPPLSQGSAPVCAPDEGGGQSYLISLQDATAVEDLNSANNTSGNVVLDRSERLNAGGIPSSPVVAGQFGGTQLGGGAGGGGGGGGTCETSVGILHPDLDIDLICSIGLLKKFWYTTEPE
ncbi:MAG: hypothetical protein WBM41_01860 [Arenicellales bacterium]